MPLHPAYAHANVSGDGSKKPRKRYLSPLLALFARPRTGRRDRVRPASAATRWRNGDLTPKTFNIPIVNDGAAEGAETVNLTLTKNWCLGDIGTQGTAVLAINDGGTTASAAPAVQRHAAAQRGDLSSG